MPCWGIMSIGPSMVRGTGMRPGTSLVRHGAPDVSGMRRLPKGLVGRVWREFARPYRGKLLLLLVTIAGASILDVLPALIAGAFVRTISQGGPGALGRLNL